MKYLLKAFNIGVNILVVYLLLVTFVHVFSKPVLSQNSTQTQKSLAIAIEEPKVSNNKLQGGVNIKNGTARSQDKIYYVIKILATQESMNNSQSSGGQTFIPQAEMVSYYVSNEFSLNVGEATDLLFEVNIPSTIRSGDYTVLAEVNNSLDEIITSSSRVVRLSGSGRFITVSSEQCRLTVDGVEYLGYAGPNINPGDQPEVLCEVQNPTSSATTVKPQLEYSVDSIATKDSEKVTLIAGEPVVVQGNSQAIINIKIPAINDPQVYEGFVTLLDEKDNIMSNKIRLRWIITGKSANIKKVELDKTYYSQGEKAKVKFSGSQSIDLAWRQDSQYGEGFSKDQGTLLENPKVRVNITSGVDARQCGSNTKDLTRSNEKFTWNDEEIEVEVKEECRDPKVDISILDGDQVLVKGDIEYKSNPEDLSKTITRSKTGNILQIVIFAVLLVIIIAGVVLFVRKRRKPPVPPTSAPSSSVSPTETASVGPDLKMVVFVILAVGISYGFSLVLKGPVGSIIDTVIAQTGGYTPGSGDVIKQPINQDGDHKNITVESYKDYNWANFRDFAENGTGGDSRVKVSGDCKEIEVTVKGYADGENICNNDAPGMIVGVYLDGAPVNPQNITSPVGNAIKAPISDSAHGPNFYNVLQYGDGGPRVSSFKLNPNFSGGSHKLDVLVGASHSHKSDGDVDRFLSSFDNESDIFEQACGGDEKCYGIISHTFSCTPPACNADCDSNTYCQAASDGCTACVEGKCQTPPACNSGCTSNEYCQAANDGCTACVEGKCQTPPACNVSCTSDTYCQGAAHGCTSCIEGKCQKPPACNDSCTDNKGCEASKDGCTFCNSGKCQACPNPGETNPHGVCDGLSCKQVNTCGITACTSDANCCPEGQSNPHSACEGAACVQREACGANECSSPDDCFNDGMCKCDGFNAINLKYPNAGNIQFESFAKVEGANINKAKVESIQFKLYKSAKSNPNQATVVASSDVLSPQIVENTSTKQRYKATWDITPPTPDVNSIYRVGANIKCAPKSGTADAGQFMPGGDTLSSDSNVLASFERSYSQDKFKLVQIPQDDDALQLGELNFLRIVDTDACSFLRFEYFEP